MKKLCGILLVLGLLLVMPFQVAALDVTGSVSEIDPNNRPSNDDGTETRTYKIVPKASAGEQVKSVKMKFETRSAIKELTCQDAGDFVVKNQEGGNGSYTCEFYVPNDGHAEGDSFQIGILKVKVNKNATDADCTIGYGLDTSTGETPTPSDNPPTGAMVPYLAITAGAVLAIGLIAATRNKTRFQKI